MALRPDGEKKFEPPGIDVPAARLLRLGRDKG
jgi:hypothetical protein